MCVPSPSAVLGVSVPATILTIPVCVGMFRRLVGRVRDGGAAAEPAHLPRRERRRPARRDYQGLSPGAPCCRVWPWVRAGWGLRWRGGGGSVVRRSRNFACTKELSMCCGLCWPVRVLPTCQRVVGLCVCCWPVKVLLTVNHILADPGDADPRADTGNESELHRV